MSSEGRRARGASTIAIPVVLVLAFFAAFVVLFGASAIAFGTTDWSPLPTAPAGWAPHQLNTTYLPLLENDTFKKDMNDSISNISNSIGVFQTQYSDAIGVGPFFMIIYGLPALLLFWRTKSPFLPSMALLIMAPIIWPYIQGSWRMAILVCIILGVTGVIYSFLINMKRP